MFAEVEDPANLSLCCTPPPWHELDQAPPIDAEFRVHERRRGAKMGPVGSTAVRDVHHSSPSRCSACTGTSTSRQAAQQLGRTLCLNPGSD